MRWFGDSREVRVLRATTKQRRETRWVSGIEARA
ncbi:hypothetical protein OIU84_024265, partial [Salix udensis]